MTDLNIHVSEEVFQVIKRFAWANRVTVQEYLHDKFKFETQASLEPKRIQEYERRLERRRAEKTMREWHGQHKQKDYRMKTFRDGRRLILSWNPSRLPEEVDQLITHKGHAGEYWARISKQKESELIDGFFPITTVSDSNNRYFKTMKAMKNFVNRQFKNHGYAGYYNVKAQAKKTDTASGERKAEG